MSFVLCFFGFSVWLIRMLWKFKTNPSESTKIMGFEDNRNLYWWWQQLKSMVSSVTVLYKLSCRGGVVRCAVMLVWFFDNEIFVWMTYSVALSMWVLEKGFMTLLSLKFHWGGVIELLTEMYIRVFLLT